VRVYSTMWKITHISSCCKACVPHGENRFYSAIMGEVIISVWRCSSCFLSSMVQHSYYPCVFSFHRNGGNLPDYIYILMHSIEPTSQSATDRLTAMFMYFVCLMQSWHNNRPQPLLNGMGHQMLAGMDGYMYMQACACSKRYHRYIFTGVKSSASHSCRRLPSYMYESEWITSACEDSCPCPLGRVEIEK
jgi:hypothetical protein